MVLLMAVAMVCANTAAAQNLEYESYTRLSEQIEEAETALGASYNVCMMSQELEDKTDTQICADFAQMLREQMDVFIRAHRVLLEQIDPETP